MMTPEAKRIAPAAPTKSASTATPLAHPPPHPPSQKFLPPPHWKKSRRPRRYRIPWRPPHRLPLLCPPQQLSPNPQILPESIRVLGIGTASPSFRCPMDTLYPSVKAQYETQLAAGDPAVSKEMVEKLESFYLGSGIDQKWTIEDYTKKVLQRQSKTRGRIL